ncbi:hypothetical protein KIN20_014666 [Parelaphostrongylus tenuis]|uniref:Uncharacterized protein n=1 Tax=Parelaphostrongylus tenuis TaxID=148309 RepID=A0AAD5QPG4_PARTN|nr:hypothetical protein KIN20_014666 [Parelaphostrongylus tenuis]
MFAFSGCPFGRTHYSLYGFPLCVVPVVPYKVVMDKKANVYRDLKRFKEDGEGPFYKRLLNHLVYPEKHLEDWFQVQRNPEPALREVVQEVWNQMVERLKHEHK